MIYLDNAATSFPKPRCVLEELAACVRKYCGNPGRSSHALSVKAAEIIYDTRERISNFLGHPTPESVVFTYNATYAINLALKSFIRKKCHVITSDIEHNAVVRPLNELAKTHGVEYSVFSTEGNLEGNIERLLREDTICIISTLASNVTGKRIDIDLLSKISQKHGLYLIIDASQAAGHTRIDLSQTPCDVLCAPGHKSLFGIQGCGFAIFADTKRRYTLFEGGSGSDSKSTEMPLLLPEGYEAGTLGTPAIAALGSGIKFLSDIGIDEISKKISKLTEATKERIISVKESVLYPSEGGIVSFNLAGLPSSLIARELDKSGVSVRAGLHCAPSAHKKLGTLDSGTVRISLSYLNTKRDIDLFWRALSKIAADFSV